MYVVNGEPLGLVYEISDGGAHGKVVALKAHRDLNLWYRTGLPYDEIHPEDPNNVGVIARSETDGQENMKAYKQIPDWKTHYPVAAYVSDLNDENGNPGWYLPAIKEVQAMVGWIDGEVLSPDGEAGQEPSEAMKEKRKAINQLTLIMEAMSSISMDMMSVLSLIRPMHGRQIISTGFIPRQKPIIRYIRWYLNFICEMVGGKRCMSMEIWPEVMEKFVRSLHFNK